MDRGNPMFNCTTVRNSDRTPCYITRGTVFPPITYTALNTHSRKPAQNKHFSAALEQHWNSYGAAENYGFWVGRVRRPTPSLVLEWVLTSKKSTFWKVIYFDDSAPPDLDISEIV